MRTVAGRNGELRPRYAGPIECAVDQRSFARRAIHLETVAEPAALSPDKSERTKQSSPATEEEDWAECRRPMPIRAESYECRGEHERPDAYDDAEPLFGATVVQAIRGDESGKIVAPQRQFVAGSRRERRGHQSRRVAPRRGVTKPHIER